MSTIPYETEFKDHHTGTGPKATQTPDEWMEPHYKVLQRVGQKEPIVFSEIYQQEFRP